MPHNPPTVKVLRRIDIPTGKPPGPPGPPGGGPPQGPPDFVQTAAVSFSGAAPMTLVVRVRPNNARATVMELGPGANPPVSDEAAKTPFKPPKGKP